MPSSGMLCGVALVRTNVSEERIASVIMVTGIIELGSTLAVTSNRSTLRRNSMWLYDILFLCSVLLFLVTANVVLSSPILLILMMEAILPSVK
jgi:hypothetical protein